MLQGFLQKKVESGELFINEDGRWSSYLDQDKKHGPKSAKGGYYPAIKGFNSGLVKPGDLFSYGGAGSLFRTFGSTAFNLQAGEKKGNLKDSYNFNFEYAGADTPPGLNRANVKQFYNPTRETTREWFMHMPERYAAQNLPDRSIAGKKGRPPFEDVRMDVGFSLALRDEELARLTEIGKNNTYDKFMEKYRAGRPWEYDEDYEAGTKLQLWPSVIDYDNPPTVTVNGQKLTYTPQKGWVDESDSVFLEDGWELSEENRKRHSALYSALRKQNPGKK